MNADDYLEYLYSKGYYDNSRDVGDKCINCENLDRTIVLTSNPPRYRCKAKKGSISESERFTYTCEDFKRV